MASRTKQASGRKAKSTKPVELIVRTEPANKPSKPVEAVPAIGLIRWTEFDSSVGAMRIASSERGVVYLQLPRENGRGFRGWTKRHAPKAELREDYEHNKAYVEQVTEYLAGKRQEFDVPLDLRATDFQLEVYEALQQIRYGELRSYGEVASEIGRPTAVRAVGAANGANPIAIIVPCHRVIASNGHLHGYGGGLELKAHLLAMERSRPRAEQGKLF